MTDYNPFKPMVIPDITNDLLLWHGSAMKFDQFDDKKSGYAGFCFSYEKEIAMNFAKMNSSYYRKAPLLYTVKLNAKNPLYVTPGPTESWQWFKSIQKSASGGNPRRKIREMIMSEGFDCIATVSELWCLDTTIIQITDSTELHDLFANEKILTE